MNNETETPDSLRAMADRIETLSLECPENIAKCRELRARAARLGRGHVIGHAPELSGHSGISGGRDVIGHCKCGLAIWLNNGTWEHTDAYASAPSSEQPITVGSRVRVKDGVGEFAGFTGFVVDRFNAFSLSVSNEEGTHGFSTDELELLPEQQAGKPTAGAEGDTAMPSESRFIDEVFMLRADEWMIRVGGNVIAATFISRGAAEAGIAVAKRRVELPINCASGDGFRESLAEQAEKVYHETGLTPRQLAGEIAKWRDVSAKQSEAYARLKEELAEANACCRTVRAVIKERDDLLSALEKCANDIEFWSTILADEWPNFDGQLYAASSGARTAIANARKDGGK